MTFLRAGSHLSDAAHLQLSVALVCSVQSSAPLRYCALRGAVRPLLQRSAASRRATQCNTAQRYVA